MTKDRARKKAVRARASVSGEPYSVAARKLGTGDADQAEQTAPADRRTSYVGEAPVPSELAARARATLAANSARLACEQDIRTSRTDPSGREAPRPTPGLVGRLARIALNRARQRFMPDLDLGHMVAEGFLEAPADRYMLDFGAYAQIVADGKVFGGLPGRSLDSLRTTGERGPDELLSVLETLAAGAEAQYDGAEEVRGTSCHQFSVRRDTVSALTVWVDGDYVRRIRITDRAARKPGREQVRLAVTKELTTDLWDFGVSLQDLDWARLPGRAPG